MENEKQRERLVELLDNLPSGELLTKDVADYLLANNVVVLPCKVGDTLYSVTKLVDDQLDPYQISVNEHKFKEIRYFIICEDDNFLDSCWGKSLFANREDAFNRAKLIAEKEIYEARKNLENKEIMLNGIKTGKGETE